MPEIPQFTPSGGLPIERDTARADPGAFAAPGLAQQRAGQGLEQIGQVLEKLQNFHDEQYYNDTLAEFHAKAHSALQNGIEQAQQTGQYQDFAKTLVGGLSDDLKQRIDNAPSGGVGSRLHRRLQSVVDQVGGRASVFEHGMAVEDAQAKTGVALDDLAKGVYRDHSLFFDNHAQGMARIQSDAERGMLNPKQRGDAERRFNNQIGLADIKARSESDPAGLAADFKAGRYDPFLDAAHLETALPLVENAQGAAAGKAAFRRQLGGAGGGQSQRSGGWGPLAQPAIDTMKAAGASDAFIQGAMANGLGEGGFKDPWQQSSVINAQGKREESFGHWQLHKGGELEDYLDKEGRTNPQDTTAQAKFLMRRMEELQPGITKSTDARAVTDAIATKFEKYQGRAPGQRYGQLAEAQRQMGAVGAPAPAGAPGKFMAAGDSIAYGVQKFGGGGGVGVDDVKKPEAALADAAGSRSSQQTLDFIKTHPERFRDQNVLLSSGLMNSLRDPQGNVLPPSDPRAQAQLALVGSQLDEMKSARANTVLMGVDQGKFAPYNAELQKIADAHGVPFAGPLPTKDVHPGPQGYRDYAAAAAKLIPGAPAEGDNQAPGGGLAGPGAPDLDAGLADLQRQVNSGALSERAGDKAMASYTRQFHLWHQATTQERAALLKDTQDATAMLASGREATIDAAGIRRLFPAEKADELLRAADEARDSGNAVNRVQFASPDELRDLQVKTMEGLNDPTDFARKQRQAKALAAAIDQRSQALDPVKGDTAEYVRGAPSVAAAREAIDPQNPGPGTAAAIQASLAEQERLGVPEQNRRVLTKPQAAAMIQQIVGTDPGKADMGPALDQAAQTYGPYWHQVFGDLVRGGLPPEAQILGAIDRPDQAVFRADFQRMLATAAAKGGHEQLKKAAPHAEVQLIDQGLDQRLADLRNSMWPDIQAFDAWKQGVRDLAYFYAFNGRNGATALENAATGLIDRKYDFDGRLRAPKGTLPTVEKAGDAVLAGIRPEQLGDIAGNPDLTPAQRQGIALDALRRGYWRTNENDTGAVRMALRRDGLAVPAIVDGKRLEFSFADADKLAQGQSTSMTGSAAGRLSEEVR